MTTSSRGADSSSRRRRAGRGGRRPASPRASGAGGGTRRKIDSLAAGHATLRRLADAIGDCIGRQKGVGWDDRSSCDIAALSEAQKRFQEELHAHEAEEDRIFGAILRGVGSERDELEATVARAHRSLEGTTALLRTLTSICDGSHVYAVRTAAERLRAELESHLIYEETVLFPRARAVAPSKERAAEPG